MKYVNHQVWNVALLLLLPIDAVKEELSVAVVLMQSAIIIHSHVIMV